MPTYCSHLLAAIFGVFTSVTLARPEVRIFHESDVQGPPSWQWKQIGRAKAEEPLEIIVAVKQTDKHLLEEMVLATSDPESMAYGEHLTLEQVNELIAPAPDSVSVVMSHLESNNITDCESTSNHDFIKCLTTVTHAENLLSAKYFYYKHLKSNVTVLRTPHYSLPHDVSASVDFISPTVRFPSPQPYIRHSRRSMITRKGQSAQDEEDDNTPDSLRKLYKIGKVEGDLGKQACTAFLEQYYSQNDLDKFWKDFYPEAKGQKIKVVGPNDGEAGVEASLDIQYITAIGGGVNTEFWSFSGRAPDNPENEPFLKWIYLVGNTSDADVPKVFSTSYGEPEHSVSSAYMHRINVEFQKAAARGISLLFATGDYGVATDDGTCPKSRFQGQWPAGSPWVTGVGGTTLGDYVDDETAWSGSAGGFSDVWDRPDYQRSAVSEYFDSVSKRRLPDASHFNQTGAGFPDVAAQATNFQVVDFGVIQSVDGTSCACPTFSGVVTLLNDLRLKQNKPTLGFLNPLFYKNAGAFMDITDGANEAGEGCGPRGFPASKGWDPVTGLGTPNYDKLAKLVNSLP